MWIMVGTSARIGEVLGMQRADVDVTTAPATARITATIRYTKKEGLHRKPAPKRIRQRRRIALPALAAEAVRDQLVSTGEAANAYLFTTKTGHPLSVSNFERLLRTFVTDNELALKEAGIDVDEFTTHLFRRTAATIVESVAGISLASRMLGHANEQVTRASYVVTAELVDPVTAQILDDALEGL
jgi:integrase